MLPQRHVKDPGHSAKCAGGRLHLNTQTPLTQRSRSGLTMPLSKHSVRTLSGNEPTRNLSGNIRPQSSQHAEPLWTDPGMKSGISVRKLISTIKKRKKEQWEIKPAPAACRPMLYQFSYILTQFGRMFVHSFPAALLCVCVCVEITSRALIPLFMPGSVHSC